MGCDCHKKYKLRDAARDILKKDFVEEKLKNQRLEICNKCGNLLAKMTCRLCGCFVNVKSRFRRASCPDGLW